LKKGVQQPILAAGLEIKPHPPKGGPPSQILTRVREGGLGVTVTGEACLFALDARLRSRLPYPSATDYGRGEQAD